MHAKYNFYCNIATHPWVNSCRSVWICNIHVKEKNPKNILTNFFVSHNYHVFLLSLLLKHSFLCPCYLQLGGSLYLSLTREGDLGPEDGHPWPGETCDDWWVMSYVQTYNDPCSLGHGQRLSQSLPGLNGGLPSLPMWDPRVSVTTDQCCEQWPVSAMMRVMCDDHSPCPGYNLINSDNSSHNLPNSSLSFVAPSKVLRAQMGK